MGSSRRFLCDSTRHLLRRRGAPRRSEPQRLSRPLVLLRTLAFAIGLAALPGTALTDSKLYQRIPVEPAAPPPSTLAQFIAILDNAAKAGNATVILENVSKDFRCLRDFGGACNDGMTASEKFSAITGLSEASDGESKSAALSRLSPLLLSRSIESTTAHGATEPILCSPAVPKFDQDLAATVEKTVFGGDGDVLFNWLAVEGRDIPAFSGTNTNSEIAGKLSHELVHVDATVSGPEGWIAVDLPSGAKGRLRASDATFLLPEQLCFAVVPSIGWQISAFVGGGD